MPNKKDSFLEKNKYYGFFSNHGFNSGMLCSPPQLGKHTSSGIDERIFNGVFYNLDNQYQQEYKYEDETELYEIIEVVGSGGFSLVHKARFLPTGEIIALKIL